jgi:5-oxoprolinase (ATP-hydrolysing) subunit A
MKLDLNCDLGEGEPRARTEALMRAITSANVACGGHAGDIASMTCCVALAKKYKVKLGAHPGAVDRAGFGRAELRMTPAELELLLLQQVGALERIAHAHSIKLHHVKLHGALYHATERDKRLAKAYVEIVRRWWPDAVVYALADGTVAKLARRSVWGEAFLDRNYLDNTALVPRSKSNALLANVQEVRERAEQLTRRTVVSLGGKVIRVHARTICVHGDTPRAVELAKVARRYMDHYS